jgi:hypothetical protein
MKLAPIRPTFLSERDAIIAAAQAGGDQADVNDVWAGFALRGMGFSARVINVSPAVVVEAFDLPILMNPSFEQGLSPWGDWGNLALIVDSPDAPDGNNEMRIGRDAGGTFQTVSAQANTTYTLSGWGRVSTPGERGWIGVHYLDSNGNYIGLSEMEFNNTTYEQKQLSVQTPANTAQMRVWAWKNSGDGYFFVDNIIFRP